MSQEEEKEILARNLEEEKRLVRKMSYLEIEQKKAKKDLAFHQRKVRHLQNQIYELDHHIHHVYEELEDVHEDINNVC